MVKVTNHVIDPHTDEGEGAIKLGKMLKSFFELDSFSDVIGRIDLFPSVTAFGQKSNIKDVDLFLIGEFDGFTLEDGMVRGGKDRDVIIKNFACTFEIKRHSLQYIERYYSDVYVNYPTTNHRDNASYQSKQEALAIKEYFKNKLGSNPWVYNYVWFWNLTEEEVQSLDNGDGLRILSSSFFIEDLFLNSLDQRVPFYDEKREVFKLSSWDYNLYDNIVTLLATEIRLPDGLTFRKINDLLTTEIDQSEDYSNIGNKLTIVSGRAGTGKTFTILRYAILIAKERSARCLILTYNKALVSDIRRMLAFMRIPSGIGESSVQILTMDQFFFGLCKETNLVEGVLDQEEFNSGYEDRLDGLYDKLDSYQYRNWDFVFVDEGQDWSPMQKDILFKYFEPNNVVVADGVDQFIRSTERLHWQTGVDDNGFDINSKTICLRQRKNLVSFVLDYCNQVGLDWEVESKNELGGGEVYIIDGSYDLALHRRIANNCKEAKCENYDILFLVPEQAVDKQDPDNPHFVLYDQFLGAGISLFDGTNPEVRSRYPVVDDSCRLFEYESCRGLEGWAVICMNFDDLIESKHRHFIRPQSNGLALRSAEEIENEYVFLWSLMPLTRAVDTLVITLRDGNSDIAVVLKKLADRHPDYVHYIRNR